MAVVENAGVELGKSVGSNSANRNPETSTTPQNDLSAGSSGGSVSDAKPNASSSGASTAKVSTDKYRNSAVVAGVITAAASLGWIHAFHLHDSVIGLANDPEAFAELRERRLALLTVAKKLRKRCQFVSPLAVVMQQQCGEGSGGAVKQGNSAVKMLAVRWVYGGCAQWQYNGCAVAVLCGWAQWLCSGF
ncbi:hypothetical protein ACFX1R_023000 [Malus domestica]